jgi:alkylhydroperoxidase family enzyme
VREAHPVEGWRMASNDRAGITINQPRKLTERIAVAKKCCTALEISMPVLVDDIDDRVGHTYSGMPDRLYLIDRDGRIAYKGGRGPFGFKSRELEQSLVMLLLDQELVAQTPHGIPLPSDAEAWKHLPRPERGSGQPLPAWARTLSVALPQTTAAMLELDYLQRMNSPLDPKLRAQMRWVAAHANHCAYSEAYALADLRREGLDEAGIRALITGNQANLSEAERAALTFAHKMTVAADTVTDAEVSQLMGAYGNNQVVAMVLLLAYANFQDRLILTLGVPVEQGGPLPPVDVHFAQGTAALSVPGRGTPSNGPAALQGFTDPEWLSLDFGRLQKEMEGQRARQARILIPSWDEVRKNLPAGMAVNRPSRIRWSLVCMGYQPTLTLAWFACTRSFGQEARQDRVFEESLFWVITRSLNCFY